MPSSRDVIQSFMSNGPWAVVGASTDRSKYGNMVLRNYQQRGMEVYPINPREAEVEGLKAYASLLDLPAKVQGISVITPPPVTEKVVEEAAKAGVKRIWMQPGAESRRAVERAEELGMEVISGGACFLVVAGFHG